MIKGISSGAGLVVSGGSFSMPYVNMSNPSAGMVRYNGNNLEVYDGNSWMVMSSSYAQIELTPEVQSILNWARMKMAEEARIQALAAKHPTVADALKAVEQAEEQVRVVAALVDNA